MNLATFWFILIAVLFTGYFVLEGFDFGVGILLPLLSRDETDRRVMINTIGPVWDGNEVWLITAGGAMFAAFPLWYASMFSGFYLPLFIILAALIIRGVSFEFRGKRDSARWKAGWDWALAIGSLVPAFAWGVAFTDLVRGLRLSPAGLYLGGNGTYTGAPQVFNPGAPIGWAATEHQLDIWHAYVKAAQVLGDPGWLTLAAELETAILAHLWNGSSFYQGYNPGGAGLVPDTGNPLDCHSWGAIWALDAGRPDITGKILSSTALAPFLLTQQYNGHTVTGYQVQYAADPSGDYPGATATISAEGTYGTAVACQHLGNSKQSAAITAAIDPLQGSDGSYPYVTVYDPVYGLTPSKAVIGPAWAILAGTPGSVWNLSMAAASAALRTPGGSL